MMENGLQRGKPLSEMFLNRSGSPTLKPNIEEAALLS